MNLNGVNNKMEKRKNCSNKNINKNQRKYTLNSSIRKFAFIKNIL